VKIELNKTYNFKIGNLGFGDLTQEQLLEVLGDGRPCSHLMERQLVHWFPELKHVDEKGFDHVDQGDEGKKYDAKNFTKHGIKFMPSGMLGKGRKYDHDKCRQHFEEHDLTIIACDIVGLPEVRVKFFNAIELHKEYPSASVGSKKREILFG
tara:strand:+ start:1991 stop:2446 length:456 start_codon:yes stop_codon:yes gene_type:complete